MEIPATSDWNTTRPLARISTHMSCSNSRNEEEAEKLRNNLTTISPQRFGGVESFLLPRIARALSCSGSEGASPQHTADSTGATEPTGFVSASIQVCSMVAVAIPRERLRNAIGFTFLQHLRGCDVLTPVDK